MAEPAMPILHAETVVPGGAENNLVVAVSGSSASEALVRTAKQLADSLGASFEAIHVEIPGADRDSSRGQRVADELVRAGVIGEDAITRIKDAIAKDIALSRPRRLTEEEFERATRQRLDRLFSGVESVSATTPPRSTEHQAD